MPICETCLHREVCGKYKATGGVNKCQHYFPVMMPKDNRCVICGEIIPEGRQVCPKCENQ